MILFREFGVELRCGPASLRALGTAQDTNPDLLDVMLLEGRLQFPDRLKRTR